MIPSRECRFGFLHLPLQSDHFPGANSMCPGWLRQYLSRTRARELTSIRGVSVYLASPSASTPIGSFAECHGIAAAARFGRLVVVASPCVYLCVCVCVCHTRRTPAVAPATSIPQQLLYSMPLTLGELAPDALGAICAHLPPRALARLLRCSRRLHSWGERWPQASVLELDLRHMAQLTDRTLEKAVRRYPAITALQLDCFTLSEQSLSIVARWHDLCNLRMVYMERHTDDLLAPLRCASLSSSPHMALGPRLTSLSLSIGSNPQTCRLTDAGVASALLACSELRCLSLDVGRRHRVDTILNTVLSTLGNDAEARPALTELELAGHYLGNAVELCFPHSEPTGGASPNSGSTTTPNAGLARNMRLNTQLLRVLSLHEREWNSVTTEVIVGDTWAEPVAAEAGAEARRPPHLLLIDRYIKRFLRPGMVPALEDLTVKAPLGDNLTQSDIDLLTKAGKKSRMDDKNDRSEAGGLRKLCLTNNGHSDTQLGTSQWADDLALMTIALGQQRLQSLELTGFRLRITTATLVEVMSDCTQITELSLAGAHQIEPGQAMHALVFAEHGGSSMLRDGPPLRTLSCNGWPLDTQSLCIMLEQPAATRGLERLHLGGCGGATDVSMLMLALNCPSLTSLVLSGAHISDIGLHHLANAVCAPRLVELSLYGCRQVTSADVLCELCTTLATIESLSFGHMPCVTDKVIRVLGLQQHNADGGRLRKLRLDYCHNLTTSCLKDIAKMFKLHHLSIRGVGFLYSCSDAASRKALSRALDALASGTPNLRRLQMSDALGSRYSNIYVDAIVDENERKLVEELASAGAWLKFMSTRPEVMVSEIVYGHTLQLIATESRIRRERRL
eukprot:COSAG02_NODE_365_length_23749_cov_13.908584_14_plen_848_part_00